MNSLCFAWKSVAFAIPIQLSWSQLISFLTFTIQMLSCCHGMSSGCMGLSCQLGLNYYSEFSSFLEKEGIHLPLCSPYTHKPNPVTEVKALCTPLRLYMDSVSNNVISPALGFFVIFAVSNTSWITVNCIMRFLLAWSFQSDERVLFKCAFTRL